MNLRSNFQNKPILIFLLILFTSNLNSQSLDIYHIDIGQGDATLIVSPIGTSMLIDGGRDGMGSNRIVPLLDSLSTAGRINRLDMMVATHYDGDHIGGLDEVVSRGYSPGVAYDRGGSGTTSTFNSYLNAISGVRETITPGTVIDLNAGVTATCIAVNGRLSDGRVINVNLNQEENARNVTLLIEYEGFDYIISGDLTGGGISGGNPTPDVEGPASELVGDVDVYHVNHHGSNTSSNREWLDNIKAEVAIASLGTNNEFGHPRQTVYDRILATQTTKGVTPLFFQTETSPPPTAPLGNLVARDGLAADRSILLSTDGQEYTISGGNLTPMTFAVDVPSDTTGVDRPPSVSNLNTPVFVPDENEIFTVTVSAVDDRGIISVILSYELNGSGSRIEIPMIQTDAGTYTANIPAQPIGTRVNSKVIATDTGAQATTSGEINYFSGIIPIADLLVNDANGFPIYNDFRVRITGLTTVGTGTFMAISTNNTDIYVQDNSGRGINVFDFSLKKFISEGDSLIVTGKVDEFNGKTEISGIDLANNFKIDKVGTGTVPNPLLIRVSDVGEDTEGNLVRINNVTRVGGDTFPRLGQNANLIISDDGGATTTTLRIDSDTNIDGASEPEYPIDVIGISGQFDSTSPFDSGYQVLPRSRNDLVVRQHGDVNGDSVVNVEDLIRAINIILKLGPEPTADELSNSDCNNDNEINVADLICIINLILGTA